MDINQNPKLKSLSIILVKKLKKSEGNGPIDSIFKAIKNIVPNNASLVLYQVNAITKGTDAQAEVSVRLQEDDITVLGQGKDIDTMVASAKAYVDALNKLILKRKKSEDSKKSFSSSVEKNVDKHVI